MSDLLRRLRLQPEDIGGPSRMDMLRERAEAADRIEELEKRVSELDPSSRRQPASAVGPQAATIKPSRIPPAATSGTEANILDLGLARSSRDAVVLSRRSAGRAARSSIDPIAFLKRGAPCYVAVPSDIRELTPTFCIRLFGPVLDILAERHGLDEVKDVFLTTFRFADILIAVNVKTAIDDYVALARQGGGVGLRT